MARTRPLARTDVVTDELCALVKPLVEPLVALRLPAVRGRTGRPRCDERAALEGIVYCLCAGVGWAKLLLELGYGWGWTRLAPAPPVAGRRGVGGHRPRGAR